MADAEVLNTLKKLITQFASLSDDNDPLVQLVSEGALVEAVENLSTAMSKIEDRKRDVMGSVDGLVTPESLTEMAVLASEFDKTGDPILMKQAAVLDEILLTIGAQQNLIIAAKNAQDIEIDKIKSKSKKDTEYDPYTMVKTEHDKQNQVEEAKKIISEKIKDYRPMEASLNTRTCPDHPGAQMARVAEHTFQCSLDKGIYNYQGGYTTMKGNKVPGGDVSNQTQSLFDRPNEFTSFETRESKLNQ